MEQRKRKQKRAKLDKSTDIDTKSRIKSFPNEVHTNGKDSKN